MADRDDSGRRIIGRSSKRIGEAIDQPGGEIRRAVVGSSSPPKSSNANSEPIANSAIVGRDHQRTGSRRRRRFRGFISVGMILLMLVPVSAFVFGWWQYSKIPTVDIPGLNNDRGGRSGTNYLIVGTDSRSGISASDTNAGAFLAEPVVGARTDTIIVLHMEGSTSRLTSLPRDLWVKDPATKEMGRINATFASGASNLVATVENLGIPIDGYLEINFVSFAKLVDAIGGITIDIPTPVKDDHSGLSIAVAGPVHLDGSQALAYVRSRYYEELVDGRWRMDPTSDLGRTQRQRAFLTALMDRISTDRNPLHIFTIPPTIGKGMSVSSNLTYIDALRLIWALGDGITEPMIIPVTPRRTAAGAEVLELKPEASAVFASLAQ